MHKPAGSDLQTDGSGRKAPGAGSSMLRANAGRDDTGFGAGGIMSWLKQLFVRRRLYRELSEEIQAHLDEKVEELVAEGDV